MERFSALWPYPRGVHARIERAHSSPEGLETEGVIVVIVGGQGDCCLRIHRHRQPGHGRGRGKGYTSAAPSAGGSSHDNGGFPLTGSHDLMSLYTSSRCPRSPEVLADTVGRTRRKAAGRATARMVRAAWNDTQ
jgi:hypothetical protein